jgi:Beta-lactamase
MKKSLFSLAIIFTFAATAQKKQTVRNLSSDDYFPPAGSWEKHAPVDVGFDTVKLNDAIRFVINHETKQPIDLGLAQAMSFGKEPFDQVIGPLADRAGPTGIIIYKGYIVAQWGDPSKVDVTNSVTKSFLSTVIGLALDQGLISNINDKVVGYMPPVEVFDPGHASGLPDSKLLFPFASEHNRLLDWEVMLRQTSDWEGEMWGKPDWADRPDADAEKWLSRKRNPPGSVWKYNDVRVNALALAATCVWRKPLPAVLKEYIMDPIGASSTWRWYGYRNSWIVLDGLAVQSVSGGGHWGGGMFINSYDMARFGLLSLHKGKWKGKQLISDSWIQQSLTPTAAQPTYGFMNFFLNTDRKYLPSAPATAFAHEGNGTNIIFVDPEHQLVVVARWIEHSALDGMVEKIIGALHP